MQSWSSELMPFCEGINMFISTVHAITIFTRRLVPSLPDCYLLGINLPSLSGFSMSYQAFVTSRVGPTLPGWLLGSKLQGLPASLCQPAFLLLLLSLSMRPKYPFIRPKYQSLGNLSLDIFTVKVWTNQPNHRHDFQKHPKQKAKVSKISNNQSCRVHAITNSNMA